ncbi:alpha/beta fold hydrolase [Aquibaculum sediminis]|uniref:alpha/beta fold hydrolase n=1 Tax=Aquibaculum sediminis TaxID=3231907 RepID=UPI0034524B9B
MIDDPKGRIDYEAKGGGPTVVLLPGSCSTGGVWRPVIAAWKNRFRCVTTSLLGYGGTAERRSANDTAMSHESEMVEAVIARAGGRVHLVGHSFGGLVALAVALRGQAPLASITVLEAPAGDLLRNAGEARHYAAFCAMKAAYFTAHRAGEAEAIKVMIDFYGGQGTFAAWPRRVRDYVVATTPVNILDWASADGEALSMGALGTLDLPLLVIWGGGSHPAMQRANALIRESVDGATGVVIAKASHFMLGTHPDEVARLIGRHVEVAATHVPRSRIDTPSPTLVPPARQRNTIRELF